MSVISGHILQIYMGIHKRWGAGSHFHIQWVSIVFGCIPQVKHLYELIEVLRDVNLCKHKVFAFQSLYIASPHILATSHKTLCTYVHCTYVLSNESCIGARVHPECSRKWWWCTYTSNVRTYTRLYISTHTTQHHTTPPHLTHHTNQAH